MIKFARLLYSIHVTQGLDVIDDLRLAHDQRKFGMLTAYYWTQPYRQETALWDFDEAVILDGEVWLIDRLGDACNPVTDDKILGPTSKRKKYGHETQEEHDRNAELINKIYAKRRVFKPSR